MIVRLMGAKYLMGRNDGWQRGNVDAASLHAGGWWKSQVDVMEMLKLETKVPGGS